MFIFYVQYSVQTGNGFTDDDAKLFADALSVSDERILDAFCL